MENNKPSGFEHMRPELMRWTKKKLVDFLVSHLQVVKTGKSIPAAGKGEQPATPPSETVEERANKYAADCCGEYDPEAQDEFDDVKRHYLAGVMGSIPVTGTLKERARAYAADGWKQVESGEATYDEVKYNAFLAGIAAAQQPGAVDIGEIEDQARDYAGHWEPYLEKVVMDSFQSGADWAIIKLTPSTNNSKQ